MNFTLELKGLELKKGQLKNELLPTVVRHPNVFVVLHLLIA